MLPPEFGAVQSNDAEELVFDLIKDQTPEGWVGLHHVGIPRHPTKPLGEIDFVVIGEPGVFCLEVKGGAARRENGIWYAGSRELRESPFAQVGSASAALRSELPEVHRFVFGYGCVFPQCPFDITGPEVLPEVVYDARMADDAFSDYIAALGKYWSSRYPRAAQLGANDISKLAHALRHDFETIKSIMPRVRAARRRLLYCTEEQARAVAGLREEVQVVIRGGAGTGKTLIAVQEALRLAEAGKQTLLTCFTKALAAHLERSVRYPNVRIAHIDSLISDLIREGQTESLVPDDAPTDEIFSLYRPLAAMEAANMLGQSSSFDALVVDEGQDLLTQPRLDVLDSLLSGGVADGVWRVFWDPLQALFLDGADADLTLLSKAGGRPVHYPLGVNCRNTQEIALRVEFLSGISIEEVASVEGPEPLDREWDGSKTQAKRLRAAANDWLERGIAVESIMILSPKRFEHSIASSELGLGLTIRDGSGQPPTADPSSLAFSTIQSFKGLESEAVLLVDVDDLDSDRMRSLLYVGASRARTMLGVLRSKTTTPTFAQRVADHARRKTMPSAEPIEVL